MNPAQIARLLRKNPSTIRVLLRRLLLKNLIYQPYPGSYCNKITYRVRFVPLLVHNVRLRSFVSEDIDHWEKSEVVGDVKVYVCFGSERRKISGFMSCDRGMTKDACLLALHRWFDLAESRLGGSLNDVDIQSFELNRDFAGLRIDGVKCVTKTGLFGMVERLYQKEENVVRHEHKVSEPMTVNQFESLLKSGVDGFNMNQAMFELKKEVSDLTKAQKYSNQDVLEIKKMMYAIAKGIVIQKENEALRDKLKDDYSW